MGTIRLVVQADDLGMCRSVNEGIEHAIVDGIVTQTSVMAPTPWFVEGATRIGRLGVTTGLHGTLTCEWRNLRWAPLSTGATLRLDDGTMRRTVEDAAASIDPTEAVDELRVQASRARACGLDLAYVDCHMGISVASAFAGACADLGVRFIYRGVDPHHVFDSLYVLSMASTDDLAARTAHFVDWLERLDDGVHFVMSHPAVASDELRAISDAERRQRRVGRAVARRRSRRADRSCGSRCRQPARDRAGERRRPVTATIRNVRASDRDAIYDICLRTADAGDDGTHLYADPLLPGHVWAGAYVALEPEHGFVVDDDDRIIGYILGALDSRAFEAELERVWWPPLRAQYPLDDTVTSPGDRVARSLIHHPSRADETLVGDFPSHLHIDLLPVAQGRGDGRRLVDRLLDSLRADGSRGVHLGVSPRNGRAIRFYRALGFEELVNDDRHLVFGMRLS